MTGKNKNEDRRALYMISVAAELAGMHPQTLRIYEQKGLITPARTPKNTRLYSDDDIARLRYIQKLTTEMGMNLAGVEKVLELEENIEQLRSRISFLRTEVEAATRKLREEVEAVHRSYRRDLVLMPKGELLVPPSRRRRRR
ncbi:MAG: MerR family transcriptional regulator [Gaiellales bacterium]|nr:MAG: MerR family transcriptional regulator [Gaiellales bacterium]